MPPRGRFAPCVMHRRHIFATTAAALLAVLFFAAPRSAAGPAVDGSVGTFRDGIHVYIDEGATADITPDDARAIARAIGNDPIYVAILRRSAGSELASGTGALPAAIARQIGRPAVVAVAVGTTIRASSYKNAGISPARVSELAAQAARDHRGEGTAAELTAWVKSVKKARAADAVRNPAARTEPQPSGPDAGSLALIGFIVIAGAAFLAQTQRKAKRELEAGLTQARSELALLDADLAAFQARYAGASGPDWERACRNRDEARARVDGAQRAVDLVAARSALGRSRGALATATARANGARPVPETDPEPVIRRHRRVWYYHPGGVHEGRRYDAGYYDHPNFWRGLYLGPADDEDESGRNHSAAEQKGDEGGDQL